MRVDAYNQVAQIYNVQGQNKTLKTTSTSSAKDQVSISKAGRDYQVAKTAVSEASDIREDKVAQLKSKIDAGTYRVDPDDFACKLLQKYNSL